MALMKGAESSRSPEPATAPGGRITPGHWFAIGIYGGRSPLDLSPLPGIRNPVLSYREISDVPAIFVADPFLHRQDGAWHMFFEVMNEQGYKGEIALAVSADGLAWEYRGIVLAEPFSLSFPHVFRWRRQVYMLPDGFEHDRVVLYRADPFPTQWRPVATLLEGRLADACSFRFGGHWWMFACEPRTNGVLRLYRAERLLGPWREHPHSPVVADDPCAARPAGRVVEWGGRLVRFAQVCSPRYGGGVRAFEITRLTPSEYAERPVARPPLRPAAPGAWNSSAVHHLCAHRVDGGRWIAAMDGHDHPSYRD
jgi:hypothetical protein